MTKPKIVTIPLTAKQQERLRRVSGQAHTALHVAFSSGRKALAAKAAPRTLSAPDLRVDPDTVVGGGLPTS